MVEKGALAFVGREGSSPGSFFLKCLMLGSWLTHGDLALETTVDFLAVSEHRLVPARVRGE